MSTCPLCLFDDESIIYKNNIFRVILVNDDNYPGFIRLIVNEHVKEMSDLPDNVSDIVFKTLLKIEKTVRVILKPDKVNLASLGNVVPHVHWHIIPRYKTDRHFPNPIWGKVTNHDYVPDAKLFELTHKLIEELKLL